MITSAAALSFHILHFSFLWPRSECGLANCPEGHFRDDGLSSESRQAVFTTVEGLSCAPSWALPGAATGSRRFISYWQLLIKVCMKIRESYNLPWKHKNSTVLTWIESVRWNKVYEVKLKKNGFVFMWTARPYLSPSVPCYSSCCGQRRSLLPWQDEGCACPSTVRGMRQVCFASP